MLDLRWFMRWLNGVTRNRRSVLEGCGDAIPCVDDGNGSAEPCQFAGSEVRGDCSVVFVGHVMFGKAREKLGPREGGLFAIGEYAGFAPDGDEIKLGGCNAYVARFIEVQLGAERAAIDLRGADLYELLQFGIESVNWRRSG